MVRERDALTRDVFGWTRDVAVTALVVTLGFIALAVVTGHAYAGLPAAAPGRLATSAESTVASPHGPEPACAACHRSHIATNAPLLVAAATDSSVCTRCHNVSGAAAVSPHSNMDFAGATQPPFSVSCTQCHDPHGNPDGGNRAMIRTTVASLTVNFTSTSGPGSFDDGMDNSLHDSICVVCHTTTSHNNVSSLELMGQGHGPVGTDCTSCHTHGDDPNSRSGFMPAATPTASATDSPVPTPTDTPVPPPTDTPVPPPTDTPVPAPTDTPAPPPTDTPTATPTPG